MIILFSSFFTMGSRFVGYSHEGPLKRRGESCLKPAKNKTKHTSSLTRNTHTRHGPRCGGPRGPPRRPSKTLPRARSASLEGSRSLERSPPRSRVHATLERAPPRSRLPHECTCSRTRVRAFSALTQQSRAITRTLTLFRQLPRGSPSPPLWGTVQRGRCQLRDTVPPTLVRLTRRALEGGPVAPSNPPLITMQGQTVTSGRRERDPRRCRSCAAIPTPAAPCRTLLQLLRRC
jgi:hypothetical protein